MRVGDIISLEEKMRNNVHVVELIEQGGITPPGFLQVDKDGRAVTMLRLPEQREVLVPRGYSACGGIL